jgi:putative oxidoreductase
MLKALGHILLGSMFIFGGWNAFKSPGGRVKRVEDAGIPAPHSATVLNGAVMAVAGTTLAAGVLPKLSAIALIGSLIPTTYVGHPYWQEEDAATRTLQQNNFLKNVAMLGGLLLVLTEK